MQVRLRRVLCLMLLTTGCARSIAGTHVELVDESGGRTYVGGAAAPGLSNSVACQLAVSQAVAAIALRFSDEHTRLGDDVAKETGLESGDALLQRFARSDAMHAQVSDTTYDPGEHICQAIVRWKPPLLLKENLTQYVQAMRERELHPNTELPATAGASPQPSSAPPSAATQPPPPASPPPAATPPPPAANPPPPASAATQPTATAPRCDRAKQQLDATRKSGARAQQDLDECLRRTQNDVNVCVRYKMYVDEGVKKDAASSMQLADCLNAPLPPRWRTAVQQALPGHAATVVESRQDGGVVLWTFSPGDATAYALEVAADGHVVQRTPLAPNQLPWLHQQLGV